MTGALDITPPSGFTDGRPWLDHDPPAWSWPVFADYRGSIFDWSAEPELQHEVTVIDAVVAEGLHLTPVGSIELQARATAWHKQGQPVFA